MQISFDIKKLINKIYHKTRSQLVKIQPEDGVFRAEYFGETWYIPKHDKSQFFWCINFLEAHERFLETIQKESTIIEVGAATGEYTIEAAKRAKEGELHAFEAESRNYRCLKNNLEIHSIENVFLNKKMVSNEESTVELEVDEESIANHTANLDKHFELDSHKSKQKNYRKEEVKSVTLDDYCQKKSLNPDIIKITANKHELEILKGAKKILEDTEFIILNHTYEDEINFLEKQGFKPEKMVDQESWGQAILLQKAD